jgi:hypothetical protein
MVIKRLFLVLALMPVLSGIALSEPYYCPTAELFTADKSLCAVMCGNKECMEYLPDNRTFPACDTANYDGFVYSAAIKKTYAVSIAPITVLTTETLKYLGTIDNIESLYAAGMLAYYKNSNLLLGYQEKKQEGGFSYPFNVVDRSRFIGSDGKSIKIHEVDPFYPNEPNNGYPGEPYIYMDVNGRWHDTAFLPNMFYELRQWNGQLQCVAGVGSLEIVEMLDETRKRICPDDGEDCFACFTGDDEETALDDMSRCSSGGTYHSETSAYLCPAEQKSCAITGESCADIGAAELSTLNGAYCAVQPDLSCSFNGAYNAATNRCVINTNSKCDTGYIFNDTTKECELTPVCNTQSAAQAAQGVFNPVTDSCVAENVRHCPNNTYTLAGGSVCETTSVLCPSGYSYDAVNKGCKSDRAICTSPLTYNSATGKCQADPICPTGSTFRAYNNKCEKSSSSYQCLYGNELKSAYSTLAACNTNCKEDIMLMDFRGANSFYQYGYVQMLATINGHTVYTQCRNKSRIHTVEFPLSAADINDIYLDCATGNSSTDHYVTLNRRNGYIDLYYRQRGSDYGAPIKLYNISCNGVCSAGLTFNTQTNICEADAAKFCSSGLYNMTTHKCESTNAYLAPGYTYTLGNYSYTVPTCANSAAFDSASGKCRLTLTNVTPPCGAGYTYNYTAKTCTKSNVCGALNGVADNSGSGKCLSRNKIACAENYDVIREGVCESPPVVRCSEDFLLDNNAADYNTALNKTNGLCMRVDSRDTVCPYGENIKCVDTDGLGEYSCSPYECFDFDNSIEVDDTQEGATDLSNDGDPNKCEFLLANGKDSRCRARGADTLWHNCCDFDTSEANKYKQEDRDAGLLFQRDFLSNPLDKYNVKMDKFWNYAVITAWNTSAFNLMMAGLNGVETITKFVGLGCTERDVTTAEKVSSDPPICMPIGRYCISSIFKKCIQYKETHCCYDSMYDLAFAKAARNSIDGFGWGDPKSPNCRGITLEEFKKIDWNDKVVKDAFEQVIQFYAKEITKSLDNETLGRVMDDITDSLINEWGKQ